MQLWRVLGPEISPDIFIYKPHSLTLDREGNLFIFDRAQHKIFQLDKNLKFVRTIGREGQEPGEFAGGRGMIYINIGPDNKLYVNDAMAQKIIVFDSMGKYLNDYHQTEALWGKPTIDKSGNIYFFSGNDLEIRAKNQRGESILKIPVESKKVYSFLFERQYLHQHKLSQFFMNAFLLPEHLLLYFENSSTMLDVAGNKNTRSYQILPKDLLENHEKSVQELVKEQNKGRYPLFSKIIVDHADNGYFYLPVVINKTTNRSLVYKINTNGELDKTFYVDYKEVSPYIWMEAIHEGIFYARLTDEQVIGIFKEGNI